MLCMPFLKKKPISSKTYPNQYMAVQFSLANWNNSLMQNGKICSYAGCVEWLSWSEQLLTPPSIYV